MEKVQLKWMWGVLGITTGGPPKSLCDMIINILKSGVRGPLGVLEGVPGGPQLNDR